ELRFRIIRKPKKLKARAAFTRQEFFRLDRLRLCNPRVLRVMLFLNNFHTKAPRIARTRLPPSARRFRQKRCGGREPSRSRPGRVPDIRQSKQLPAWNAPARSAAD